MSDIKDKESVEFSEEQPCCGEDELDEEMRLKEENAKKKLKDVKS